jgi:hypothetical protein
VGPIGVTAAVSAVPPTGVGDFNIEDYCLDEDNNLGAHTIPVLPASVQASVVSSSSSSSSTSLFRPPPVSGPASVDLTGAVPVDAPVSAGTAPVNTAARTYNIRRKDVEWKTL